MNGSITHEYDSERGVVSALVVELERAAALAPVSVVVKDMGRRVSHARVESVYAVTKMMYKLANL